MKILLHIPLIVLTSCHLPNPDIMLNDGGLNFAELLEVRQKLAKVEEEAKAEIVLPPEEQSKLDEATKNMSKIMRDPLQHNSVAIEDINEESGIADLLYQGDMVLTKPQADEIVDEIKHSGSLGRIRRQAYRDSWYPFTIWSQGVNYFFHPNATAETRKVFLMATELWRRNTCIDFRFSNTAPDRIGVFKGYGCYSNIGRTGRVQSLSLGENCENLRNAAHEIGHALGLFHTQSRHDRDYFIRYNSHNVRDDWLSQFNRETTDTNDNYGITYDYGSIMHYGARSASRNGLPTMVPSDTKYMETLGSYVISFNDLRMINVHYNCTKRCDPNRSAKCKMGGFPHPRDCSKCICPGGYGGDLCEKRPDDCGREVDATNEYQYLYEKVGDRSAGMRARLEQKTCTFWIKAPMGAKIEVKVEEVWVGLYGDGCQNGGVEIKTQKDQRLTGYRFCAPEDRKRVPLKSHSNIVPVVIFNRYFETRARIAYRIVPGTGPSGPVKPETTSETSELAPIRKPEPMPETGHRCVDHPKCAMLMKIKGFCQHSILPESMKKRFCARSCGYCGRSA